jgi:hypothetical protein
LLSVCAYLFDEKVILSRGVDDGAAYESNGNKAAGWKTEEGTILSKDNFWRNNDREVAQGSPVIVRKFRVCFAVIRFEQCV